MLGRNIRDPHCRPLDSSLSASPVVLVVDHPLVGKHTDQSDVSRASTFEHEDRPSDQTIDSSGSCTLVPLCSLPGYWPEVQWDPLEFSSVKQQQVAGLLSEVMYVVFTELVQVVQEIFCFTSHDKGSWHGRKLQS